MLDLALSNQQLATMRYRLPPYRVQQVVTALAETIDWGLAAYGVPEHWKKTQGEGVRVAVLDTGIDDHVDLRGAIVDARDFSGSRSGAIDRAGHGTHVAGTIAARKNELGVVGVAPKCELLIGKVLGDDGAGSDLSVCEGIDWAIQSGAHVISMSLGGPGYSASIAQFINLAFEKGRFVICAAGNDGNRGRVNFPASMDKVVAVGAVDREGRVADFSSRGDEVDVAAPGQDVLSTYLGGRYARMSGTSMATPFVTGVVALLLAKHLASGGASPVRTQQQLEEHLRRTARDAGATGRDPSYGYGLIDPDSVLASKADATRPAEPTPIAGGTWVWIPGAMIGSKIDG